MYSSLTRTLTKVVLRPCQLLKFWSLVLPSAISRLTALRVTSHHRRLSTKAQNVPVVRSLLSCILAVGLPKVLETDPLYSRGISTAMLVFTLLQSVRLAEVLQYSAALHLFSHLAVFSTDPLVTKSKWWCIQLLQKLVGANWISLRLLYSCDCCIHDFTAILPCCQYFVVYSIL